MKNIITLFLLVVMLNNSIFAVLETGNYSTLAPTTKLLKNKEINRTDFLKDSLRNILTDPVFKYSSLAFLFDLVLKISMHYILAPFSGSTEPSPTVASFIIGDSLTIISLLLIPLKYLFTLASVLFMPLIMLVMGTFTLEIDHHYVGLVHRVCSLCGLLFIPFLVNPVKSSKNTIFFSLILGLGVSSGIEMILTGKATNWVSVAASINLTLLSIEAKYFFNLPDIGIILLVYFQFYKRILIPLNKKIFSSRKRYTKEQIRESILNNESPLFIESRKISSQPSPVTVKDSKKLNMAA